MMSQLNLVPYTYDIISILEKLSVVILGFGSLRRVLAKKKVLFFNYLFVYLFVARMCKYF